MGKGGAAIILEWAEQGIGVDLIAGSSQETAAVIAAKVVTMRDNGSAVIKNGPARGTVQNGIRKVDRVDGIDSAALTGISGFASECGIGDSACTIDQTA